MYLVLICLVALFASFVGPTLVVVALCIAIKLILAVRALRRSTASYTGNIMLGLLMAFGGLYCAIAVLESTKSEWLLVIPIMYLLVSVAMLIPMDSSILSSLRPFRLEKPVLPQYQLYPQMPIMSPVPAYHQPAPVDYQHPAPAYQQPSPVYQQQFVDQQAYPTHPGPPPMYDVKQ